MYFKTYAPFWEHREEYIQHLSCSLIVASRFHPTPLLLSLLDFVAPSRPFVVYCQYKEVIKTETERRGVLVFKYWFSHCVALEVILNRTFSVPSAFVGMLHKTAGKRRGHQPQAVWNLAQKLPGTFLSASPGAARRSLWMFAVVLEIVKYRYPHFCL